MQTWDSAYELEKTVGEIRLLYWRYERFLCYLGYPYRDNSIVLDINKARRNNKSFHKKDIAIDFTFHRELTEFPNNSEIIRAGFKANFYGIGIYSGKNQKSYHLDVAERTAIWYARPSKVKGKKWMYFYYNLKGGK